MAMEMRRIENLPNIMFTAEHPRADRWSSASFTIAHFCRAGGPQIVASFATTARASGELQSASPLHHAAQAPFAVVKERGGKPLDVRGDG